MQGTYFETKWGCEILNVCKNLFLKTFTIMVLIGPMPICSWPISLRLICPGAICSGPICQEHDYSGPISVFLGHLRPEVHKIILYVALFLNEKLIVCASVLEILYSK